MKKLLIALLITAMLFSSAITASAETVTDDKIPGAVFTADEQTDGTLSDAVPTDENEENTASDNDTPNEPETSSRIKIVASEADLPEGYVIDPNFSITIPLNDENGWSYKLTDILEGADDEYIYFVVEENVAQGYTPVYYSVNSNIGKSSTESESSGGKIIVVKNVHKGEPPTYELPESGGIGATPYIVAGSAILMIAAVYFMILRHKRKASAQ